MNQWTGYPQLPMSRRQMASYVCALDPCRPLHEAICHDHHKMPTMEEVAHEFVHSCFFTKLDACHGFWSIVLNQDSSLLTDFQQSFWKIPFPCNFPLAWFCSKDIFQKKMDQILKVVPRMYWNCRRHHHTWPH